MGAYKDMVLSRDEYSDITTDGRLISYMQFDSINFLIAYVTIQILLIN